MPLPHFVSYSESATEAPAWTRSLHIDPLQLCKGVPAGFDALIYCDGACSGNGVRENAPGGWGAAVVRGDSVLMGKGGSPASTNNKMELTAAIEGLRQLPDGAKAVLRTDSQYVVKGCNEWRAGWTRNGMRNAKREPVKNAELWHQLWAQVDRLKVRMEWVRGHNGDPGNELADQLAVMGARR